MEHSKEEPSLSDEELRRIVWTSLPSGTVHKMANALLNRREELSEQDGAEFIGILTGSLQTNRARILAAESLRFAKLDAQLARRAESVICGIVSKRTIPDSLFFFIRVGNWLFRNCVLTLFLVCLNILVQPSPDFGDIMQVLGLVYLILPFASFAYDGHRRSTLHKQCVRALGRVGGPASIGVLISAVSGDVYWKAAKSALRRVLNDLKPQYYGCVGPQTISSLNTLLLKPFLPQEAGEWTHLVLDALEKVGNGSSVEAVQEVVKRGRYPAWRDHASRVLPILLERQRLERDSSRLLRAVTADVATDALLRPAGTDSSVNKDLLLHTVQDE